MGAGSVVGIIMGSSSDADVMMDAAKVLDGLRIRHEDQIISAHRTPTRLAEYARHAEDGNIVVIIAGAGGAAHLPGMMASHTIIPVIGVPIMAYNNKNQLGASAPVLSAFGGLDSLLSITEMPSGAPVVSVGINKAKNAGIYAAMMLARTDPDIKNALSESRKKQYESVVTESEIMRKEGLSGFAQRRVQTQHQHSPGAARDQAAADG